MLVNFYCCIQLSLVFCCIMYVIVIVLYACFLYHVYCIFCCCIVYSYIYPHVNCIGHCWEPVLTDVITETISKLLNSINFPPTCMPKFVWLGRETGNQFGVTLYWCSHAVGLHRAKCYYRRLYSKITHGEI